MSRGNTGHSTALPSPRPWRVTTGAARTPCAPLVSSDGSVQGVPPHAIRCIRARSGGLRPGHIGVHAVRPALGHRRRPARPARRRGAADLGLRGRDGDRRAARRPGLPHLAPAPGAAVLPRCLRRRPRRRRADLQLRGPARHPGRRRAGQRRFLGGRAGHRPGHGRPAPAGARHRRRRRRGHRRVRGGRPRGGGARRALGLALGVLGRGPGLRARRPRAVGGRAGRPSRRRPG